MPANRRFSMPIFCGPPIDLYRDIYIDIDIEIDIGIDVGIPIKINWNVWVHKG